MTTTHDTPPAPPAPPGPPKPASPRGASRFALVSGASDAVDACWQPVLDGWPVATPVPEVDLIHPDELLGLSDEDLLARGWDAAILDSASQSSSLGTLHVIDALREHLVPTVHVERDESWHGAHLYTGGQRTTLAAADPVVIASILFALSKRQRVVRNLDKHLALVQSFQGEAVAEIGRLHDELLLAAKVQRDFMPKEMVSIDGLEVALIFRPASFVSGDIYDVFRISETEVGFFLADAMGHGVPAALMTLFISSHMPRFGVADGWASPAKALGHLGRELHDARGGPTRFATAIAGRFNAATGEMTLSVAGHPPPLLVGPDGLRPVDASGMLLGVLAEATYEDVEVQLQPGEALVIHSDGVETAFHESTEPNRLKPNALHLDHFAQLADPRVDSIRGTMQSLADVLDIQQGSINQVDDVTILALRRSPTAAVHPDGVRAAA